MRVRGAQRAARAEQARARGTHLQTLLARSASPSRLKIDARVDEESARREAHRIRREYKFRVCAVNEHGDSDPAETKDTVIAAADPGAMDLAVRNF